MSMFDVDSLSANDAIVQFIVECRGHGHFLPYTDYAIVEEWLSATRDADDLLLILADILPDFFAKAAGKSVPPALKGVRKRVMKKLRERAMRQQSKTAAP